MATPATIVEKIVHPIREAGLDPFKMKLKKLLEYGGGAFAATSPTDEKYFEGRAATMLSLLSHGKLAPMQKGPPRMPQSKETKTIIDGERNILLLQNS